MRKIALSLLAVFVAAFLWTISFSTITHAADATWDGDTIVKDGNKYTKESGAIPDIPPGHQAYVFKPQPTNPGDPISAQVIYFPDNADVTKPVTAQQATYQFANNQYGNHGPPSAISIDAKGANGAGEKEKTQCDVAGIGWIICSTSRFLAGAMDNFFKWISNFFLVKPITGDTDNALYKAWSVMLGLANTAFVLAFLVIIYSQITSLGFNNYNVKKMIPRLIIAAIMVNISYYVCAIAVDISNIVGNSLQQALIDIRNELPSPNPGGVDFNWRNLTEYLLSAGTIGAAGFAGWTAFTATTGGSLTALVPLLVPILIAGMLAFVVVLLLLAARQALITILIVVSPLAFVAYLLPNTEKWFEKWRELFTTMLMVFPMFSLLFGGSQLASFIIIKNAETPTVAILGLFVQAAPLALTPFLVRFSGTLIGRLAGMVNDRSKGVYDNASNWAKERVDKRKGIGLEKAARGRGTVLQRSAFRREKARLDREGYKKRGEEAVEAGWHEDSRYRAHHSQFGYTEDRKKAAEARATEHMERIATAPTNQAWQEIRGARRISEAATKTLQTNEEAEWQESLSRNMQANNRFESLAQESRTILEQQRIADGRVTAAQAMQKSEYASDLIKSEALQVAVGGIADHGAQRALASAVSEYRKEYGDRINEATAILKHYNLSGAQRQAHALGEEITVYDENSNMKILRKDSLFTREAAIETQLSTGTYKEIEEIVSRSGKELEPFKTTISAAIASNKLSSKAVFLGGKTIDDTGQGKLTDMSKLMEAVTATIARGKISANDLATNENEALKRILEAARDRHLYRGALNTEENAALDGNIDKLKEAANQALTHPTISRDLRENARKVLEDITNL